MTSDSESFLALSQHDRTVLVAMQDAMKAVPAAYREHRAASQIWIEGYIAGAVGPSLD